MNWKDIVKQEEDFYADDTKEMISRFRDMQKEMERIKQEYKGIESSVEKYVKLLRDYKEEIRELSDLTNDFATGEGKTAEDFKENEFDAYEDEAFDFLVRIQRHAEEIYDMLRLG
tara:strand:+ start:406 stop:750 length:345 start_codon:yes stop_codon:yes gene_type:complete